MTSESWKPVVGYEDCYEVSSRGRVRRIRASQGARVGHVLALQDLRARGGYLAVGIRRPGEKKKFARVHRLVAEAFLGPSELPLVRHLDGNPKNNDVSNLAYGDASQNAIDRTQHGRSRDSNQYSGATHCRNGHEYTSENTKVVRANGGQGRKCRTCIRAAARRKYWREKEVQAA